MGRSPVKETVPSEQLPVAESLDAADFGDVEIEAKKVAGFALEVTGFDKVVVQLRGRDHGRGGEQSKHNAVTHEVFLLFSGEHSRRIMRICNNDGFSCPPVAGSMRAIRSSSAGWLSTPSC